MVCGCIKRSPGIMLGHILVGHSMNSVSVSTSNFVHWNTMTAPSYSPTIDPLTKPCSRGFTKPPWLNQGEVITIWPKDIRSVLDRSEIWPRLSARSCCQQVALSFDDLVHGPAPFVAPGGNKWPPGPNFRSRTGHCKIGTGEEIDEIILGDGAVDRVLSTAPGNVKWWSYEWNTPGIRKW